ncbi:MAG: hydrogenase maturation nickel metallochaperone HypA [Deltaproteobacteria bacterium]|nr:hydrogenase maturation nickel metallochaperone HypA [Deltaproteobacteria bacterium]MBW2072511.1 hydrogenase maturation nickel metallochaperone HypA [Deltaproteobacteria bacterium]
MHEMAIAQNLLDIVIQEGSAHGVSRVLSLSLKVGELSTVVPESLIFCFELLSKGTLAEGARLDIEKVPTICRCRECDHEFSVTDLLFSCPKCGSGKVELQSGRELTLESFEGE